MRELFEEMLMRRNVVCRTAMINVYGKEKDFVGDVEFVFQMLVSADEVQLNATTMVCLPSACSTLCNYGVGRFLLVFIDVNNISLNAILVLLL